MNRSLLSLLILVSPCLAQPVVPGLASIEYREHRLQGPEQGTFEALPNAWGRPYLWAEVPGLAARERVKDRQPHFIVKGDARIVELLALASFNAEQARGLRYVHLDDEDQRRPSWRSRVKMEKIQLGEGVWDIHPRKPLAAGEYTLCLLSLGLAPLQDRDGHTRYVEFTVNQPYLFWTFGVEP